MMRGRVAPDIAFDLRLEHGRCIGVRLPAPLDRLVAEERALAARLVEARRDSWVGGRVALRTALERENVDAPAIVADDRGAPAVPRGIAASISHKGSVAVALVAREVRARIGVDVEQDAPPRVDVSARVLAEDEAGDVLLRFSAKEAIYKALDPFVRRYVAFKEVSVMPRADGSAEVRARLREGPFAIDVHWRRFDGLLLTTSRVDTW